ncbi:MAG: Peptidyl-tRNA hydrolase [uncultured Truepera sp.]|uniref:Peptidyl-tRNA hydrolase n=1 Tax=uncultured Truepera sp. TaxID=543023 RepID=A0A6J4UXG5_9DEIN|nr:MAG: Peptidyl-tRNA hydrolase [uncultured Truepera sp.]
MTPSKKLIVGLGNPGPQYRETRHNAGFLVLDALAARHGVSFRVGKNAEEAKWEGVTLLKPTTFMNASGSAVQAALSKARLTPADLLIVHDDLDLPFGRLRIRTGGSAGGQRGVADTVRRLGPEFTRLKVGISRPPAGWKVDSWVLSRFQEAEKSLLKEVVENAADAVEVLLKEGTEAAMGRFNGLDLRL